MRARYYLTCEVCREFFSTGDEARRICLACDPKPHKQVYKCLKCGGLELGKAPPSGRCPGCTGAASATVVWVTCPSCKERRQVFFSQVRATGFTGLCRHCAGTRRCAQYRTKNPTEIRIGDCLLWRTDRTIIVDGTPMARCKEWLTCPRTHECLDVVSHFGWQGFNARKV